MELEGQLDARAMIDSLNGWWALAGVDGAVADCPVDWLALDAPKPSAKLADKAPLQQPPPMPKSTDWPVTMEALRSAIHSGATVPGNNFGKTHIVSTGPAQAQVMIISDLPDPDEGPAALLGSGSSGRLLARMMAAIGFSLAQCHWAALATTIPVTGELPEDELPKLAAFMRHQIGLVAPDSLLLLGSAACRALLGQDMMSARLELRYFNHDGRTMAAMATYHPRTLMARPTLKAQAWRDLQMFAKRDGQ
jgi:uracil-DNA glycosylase